MPSGMSTKNGWKNLRSKYEEKTGLKQTKKQLKNKLDNMKNEYTWFMELKNSATGLGWNKAKQTDDLFYTIRRQSKLLIYSVL